MNKRILSRWVLLSIASMSGLAMCGAAVTLRSASAASPVASASASASASAATNAPVGPPKREPIPEKLEKQTVPTEKSPVPTFKEWQEAPPVEVERRSYDATSCTVFRVREWLKVKCDMAMGAIHQHSGNPEGVAFWIRPKDDLYTGMESKNGGEMIFPMRPGDRRLLQFFDVRHDPCIGVGYGPSVMVDETWIEGDPAPIVVLR